MPKEVTIGRSNSYTYVGGVSSKSSFENCYYTEAFGTAQGWRQYSITFGDKYMTSISNARTVTYEYEVRGLARGLPLQKWVSSSTM